ncbi:hypothetical protein FNL55_17030 [Tardiphaga sp. vice352]|uniref:hypothetical protein n=1 Tax=Tardiphaga sp. vice352 TaxID=2592816 RepID=UPI001165992D|nr:hypothetical protein [Tardiphaga sp. vice352]QDM32869.1 hypothetical protein FNL55_17030 [Tardiphaga sp. vice352]
MIINCTKHGRTARETAKLATHLYKTENLSIVLAEIGNSAAIDLKGVLLDMELVRDGAIPGAAAFHHFPLSPATDRTDAEIVEAAHKIRKEFDPHGTRAFCIIIHGKLRAGDAATGKTHGHLILGNFDAFGRAIKDRFTKIRTERLSREIEFSWRSSASNETVETCGLGRHHLAVVRALRNSNPPAAEWLVAAHGEKPAKPNSAISGASRNRAKRLDFNLPAARAAVQKMWADTREFGAFKVALSKAGFEVAAGSKAGVWVLIESKSEFVVGAVDRLLRMQRQTVNNMIMERPDDRNQPEGHPRFGAADCGPRTKTIRPEQIDHDAGGSTAAAFSADRRKQSEAGEGSDRGNSRIADHHRQHATETRSASTHTWKEARLPYRKIERQRAIRRLNGINIQRIISLAATYAGHHPFEQSKGDDFSLSSHVLLIDGKDIWGIPAPAPRH